MGPPEQEFDQRKSFRCPLPQSQQEAELRIGRRRFTVRLFNESSGGFAALTDRDLGVAVDDILMLASGGTRCEVRVAYVVPLEIAETELKGGGAVFRLGLQRLRELPMPSDGRRFSGRLLGRCAWRRVVPTSTLVIGGSVVLVVAALMGALAVLTNLNSPLVQKLVGWQHGANQPLQNPDHALAQVVKELGLSRPQQLQIQDIATKTVDTLQAIDALWKDDPPDVRARKQALLLEVAKKEIMKLLSEQQRARWKTVVE